MPEYDALVIGGGHNALTSACYLAQAGLSVALFERRGVIGGAACTETGIFPGYRVDVGSAVHIMIHRTPVVRELELEAYGLRYLDLDPMAWQPTPDGGFGLYRSLDQTVDSIAQVSPRDAMAYRAFIREWQPFARNLFKAFQKPPTPANLGASFVGARPPDLKTVQAVLGAYGPFLRAKFHHPSVRAAFAWLAAQSGPAPSEIGAGGFLMWHAALHDQGAKRAVGGSGALSEALARRLESLGGQVHLNAPVARIEGRQGRAGRVILRDGRVFSGRVIVSGAHVQTTMLDLLDPALLPANIGLSVREIRVGNGFGMMHRMATGALPAYDGAPPEAVNAMQLLCPSLEHLEAAYLDYKRGAPSSKPGVLAMSFSGLDPTIAPPGKHLVYLWSQYYPFLRSDGRDWSEPDAVAEEAAKVEEVLYGYSPNLRGQVEARFTQSPLDLQERIGLKNGNVMHVEMSLDQLFFLRPTPELSGYRTPIAGLYLTGASMHPGGGVFAASGRATAKVVLHDLAGGYTGKAVTGLKRAISGLAGRRSN